MRTPALAALVTLPLAARGTAQLTEGDVSAAFEEARRAVAECLGRAPAPEIPLTFTTAVELGDAVAEESLPTVLLRQPERAKAASEAELIGRQYAASAIAKYSWSQEEILVVLDSWNELALQRQRPELLSAGAVRAVLVHELVHALDDAVHDFAACALRCTTTDLAAGLNAVIEGHAQHVARAVCAQAGWSEGFEQFTAQIGAVRERGLDEATRLFLNAQGATLASAYHDGERFIAALEASGGSELVARAFQAPPDGETILHPQWFIDPASRPVLRYDPEPALERFLQAFPVESWSSTRFSLTPVQVASGLALLPAESVQRIQASLRSARAVTLQLTAAPGERSVVMALLEFDSTASAEAYLVTAGELARIKDERMKNGQTRILSATYAEVELEGGRGLLAEKRVKSGAQEFEVTSLDLQRGCLVLETVLSVEPMEREAHVELAKAGLAAVRER
jgi:hypothetical protein